jgi:beta-1,4-mannosyl-glycoprotein beta-1,4-N-acetylglucosaminyltransferase
MSDGRCLSLLDKHPLALIQNIYYYHMNIIDDDLWFGTIAIRKRNFTMSPEELRTLRFRLPRRRNGGWHFSYMGGARQITRKLNSIVAIDDNNPDNNNLDQLEYKIAQGVNILKNRGHKNFIKVKVDESYPRGYASWIERHPEYSDDSEPVAVSSWNPSWLPTCLSHCAQWEWFLLRRRFNRKMNWD